MKKIITLIVLVVIVYFGFKFFQKSPTDMSLEIVSVPSDVASSSFCHDIVEKTITENFNEGNNPVEFTTLVTCTIPIGHSRTAELEFKNNAAEGDEPDFDIGITSSGFVSSSQQHISLAYSPTYSRSDVNLHDDINFDGYKDMLLRVLSPRAAQFTYYVYNPKTRLFDESEALSSIFLPTFDAEKKQITATADIPNYYVDDSGEQQYYTPEEQTTVFVFKDGEYVSE